MCDACLLGFEDVRAEVKAIEEEDPELYAKIKGRFEETGEEVQEFLIGPAAEQMDKPGASGMAISCWIMARLDRKIQEWQQEDFSEDEMRVELMFVITNLVYRQALEAKALAKLVKHSTIETIAKAVFDDSDQKGEQ